VTAVSRAEPILAKSRRLRWVLRRRFGSGPGREGGQADGLRGIELGPRDAALELLELLNPDSVMMPAPPLASAMLG
jgi:hypothetical protein